MILLIVIKKKKIFKKFKKNLNYYDKEVEEKKLNLILKKNY